MAEIKTYAGSCHCGNVRFEVTTKPCLEGVDLAALPVTNFDGKNLS